MLTRGKGPITLWVGHSPDQHDIAVLYVDKVFLESFKVVGFMFLIGIIGCHVDSVQGIETHTPLKTGTCLVSDETEHLDFFDQIIHILVDVSESVNLSPSQMRGDRHQAFVLRP